MKKHISFPSIDHFKTARANVNRSYNFVGLDDNGEPMYDQSINKPTVAFKGTVKLHGTNAAVCYNEADGLWAQSRENIITVEKDNAGFAFFVHTKQDVMVGLCKMVADKNGIDLTQNTVSVYGEWAGGNVQKGVGLNYLPKSFFVFGVKITPFNADEAAYWVDHTYLTNHDENIYNVTEFGVWEIDVDFEKWEKSQNEIVDLTVKIEDNCPATQWFFNKVKSGSVTFTDSIPVFEVANGFTDYFKEQIGKELADLYIPDGLYSYQFDENESLIFFTSGTGGKFSLRCEKPTFIGEGLVFVGDFKNNRIVFKSKGEKHSKSKVNTATKVDDERAQLIRDVADLVTPSWRLEQMLVETFDLNNGGELDIKRMGDYIRKVVNDVIKEESETIVEKGLEIKDISKCISDIARKYFFTYNEA